MSLRKPLPGRGITGLLNIKAADLSPWARSSLNWLITGGSVLLCLMVLPMRLPGMELLGIGPNWLLIWVVAWSLNRPLWQGIMAGLVLGLLQDAMTSPEPSHVLSLMVVGLLSAKIQKQRYIQEDFISVALIVFGMVIVAETLFAIQYSFYAGLDLTKIWILHQRLALASAILSSLWAPIIYYPLNRWWEALRSLEDS